MTVFGLAVLAPKVSADQSMQVIRAPASALEFGACSAIGNGMLFISASYTNQNQGVVYAYDIASDFRSPAMVFAESLGSGTYFGRSIAASGEWLAVCSGLASNASGEPGRLFLYRNDGEIWTLTDSAEVPADGCGGCWSEGPNLIEFAGDQILWGHGAFDSPSADQGAVHVFDIDEGMLTHRQSLQQSSGSTWDYFGNGDIACDGDWMMACARLDDITGPQYGSVAVYRRNRNGEWSETQMIAINPSLGSFPNFGASIAISENRACITAGNGNGEHVYVFELSAETNTWDLSTELDLSGSGVSHSPRVEMPSATRIVVSSRGRILVFDLVDGVWTRTESIQTEIPVADGNAERRQLSTDGRFIVAGAEYEPEEDPSGYQEFALLIDLNPAPPCTADLSGNGLVDGGDLGIWLALAGNDCQSDPACPADLNGDGIVDGADIGEILGAWGPCPE